MKSCAGFVCRVRIGGRAYPIRSVGAMTSQRNRIGNWLSSEPPAVAKPPTQKFPVQQTIYRLEKGLAALNERIAELEGESHNGRAMKVLKENALDLARQIDELRSVLVEPRKQRCKRTQSF